MSMTNDFIAAAQALEQSVTNAYNLHKQAEQQRYERTKYAEETEYVRDLQQRIFEREDNAVQRRMADLQAAGLNPLLAVSSSGANAGSALDYPSNYGSTVPQARTPIQALELAKATGQLEYMAAQRQHMNVQNDLMDAQREIYETEAKIKKHDYEILDKTNILSTSSGWSKDIANAVNNVLTHYQKLGQSFERFIENPGAKAQELVEKTQQGFTNSMKQLENARDQTKDFLQSDRLKGALDEFGDPYRENSGKSYSHGRGF